MYISRNLKCNEYVFGLTTHSDLELGDLDTLLFQKLKLQSKYNAISIVSNDALTTDVTSHFFPKPTSTHVILPSMLRSNI